ncbi:hypothetical protein A9P44_13240 [Paenibacillus polymyxa]|nr:hypothetical protein [Paenibacillus polymyxa]OBA05666.1 hypothetical protein A9P44_13240 [Paenibacillus polymyxa]
MVNKTELKASDLRQLAIDKIIAAPFLNDFKYLKSRKVLKKEDKEFIFEICFSATKYSALKVYIIVESKKIKKKYSTGVCFHSELIALTKKYTGNRDYLVSTEAERERVIQEIIEDIHAFALPFFKRFEHLETLAEQVHNSGFLPHRKRFDTFNPLTKRFIDFYYQGE